MRSLIVLAVTLAAVIFALTTLQAHEPVLGDEYTSFVPGTTLNNTGGAAITSAATGKKQILVGFALASDTAGTITFRDGDGGDAIGAIYLAQNSTLVLGPDDIGEGIKTTAGNAIYADNNGAVLTGMLRLRRE